ncbi:MAG: pseudouridine synthase [Lachnospiraceae bacterium]|nr:pseudouridine synthase [Lachnospiraceae bacterium]
MKLRIDKYLADMGIGSRSDVKAFIRKGIVKINKTPARTGKEKVDTDCDIVFVNEEPVEYVQYEYYLINKPAGVISATEDRNTPTVVDLIKGAKKDVFPVGRLDKDTEGLLLITNDGLLAHNLLAPKKHVDKKYYAETDGPLNEDNVRQVAQGLKVDDDFTALPAQLEIIEAGNDYSKCYITLHEGKFHQIKRMMAAMGCNVTYLKRISMGGLTLPEELAPGEYIRLSPEKIKLYFKDNIPEEIC